MDKHNNIFLPIICVPSDGTAQTMRTILSATSKLYIRVFSQNAPFRISYAHINKLLNVATIRSLVQGALDLQSLPRPEEHYANAGMRYYTVMQGGCRRVLLRGRKPFERGRFTELAGSHLVNL
jgi:hypothetical protein